MLTPGQIRAARGWLGLTQGEVADRAKIGLSTVRDLETERRQISSAMLEAIRTALEAEGVQFTYWSDGKPRGIEAISSSDPAQEA